MRAGTAPRMTPTSRTTLHVARSTRVVGKRSGRNSYYGKNPPHLPAHRSGPGPTTRRAYVWPRPGGSCRCTKVGALLLTPLLVHGQSEPRTTATLSRAEEGSRREAEAQDNQGNAKTRNTGEQEGEVDSLSKILAEAASAAPASPFAGATRPHQWREPPLNPRPPMSTTTLDQGSRGTSMVACRSL